VTILLIWEIYIKFCNHSSSTCLFWVVAAHLSAFLGNYNFITGFLFIMKHRWGNHHSKFVKEVTNKTYIIWLWMHYFIFLKKHLVWVLLLNLLPQKLVLTIENHRFILECNVNLSIFQLWGCTISEIHSRQGYSTSWQVRGMWNYEGVLSKWYWWPMGAKSITPRN